MFPSKQHLCLSVHVLDLPLRSPNCIGQGAAASSKWCGSSQTGGKLLQGLFLQNTTNRDEKHRYEKTRLNVWCLCFLALKDAFRFTIQKYWTEVLRVVIIYSPFLNCFISSLLPASPLTRGILQSLWHVHVCLWSPCSVEEKRAEETGQALLRKSTQQNRLTWWRVTLQEGPRSDPRLREQEQNCGPPDHWERLKWVQTLECEKGAGRRV